MGAYDLRIYDVADGELGTLQGVLRDLAMPMMPDHDMEPIGFWADEAANRLYQITRHASLAAVTDNWDPFHADPRWAAGLKEHRGETSAVRQVSTVLLTDFIGMPPSIG